MKNFVKNLLIAFLMILAIYQTTELWFEEFSSHNFFSFISAGGTSSGQAQLYGLDRLIINLGDNMAVCRSENVTDTTYRTDLDKLITAAVNKGELSSGQIDWTHLFSNRCVIYDFGTPMSVYDFKTVLGIKNKHLQDIDKVDLAVIVPNTTENMLQVYISGDSKTVLYTLKSMDLAQKGISAISDFSANANDFNYISSRGNGFNIFTKNTFIPAPQDKHNTINVTNPVMDGDRIDTKALEGIVNGFFDNPAVKWSSLSNNVYSYSDENNVVKYNLNGVLEYSGYNTSESSAETQNIMTNFAAAVDFIKKDTGITNDVVFSSISENSGKTVFYFDYSINNTAVELSSDLKEGLGLNAAVEVTVSKGSIVRYRRYVCCVENSGETHDIKTDFVNAVDNVYNKLDNTDKTVDSIDLVYKINGRQNGVSLSWQVVIDKTTYWEAA